MITKVRGTSGNRPAFVPMNPTGLQRPGVAMFLSLLSAFAVGLVLVAAALTLVIPFVLGCFGRGDHH